MSQAQDDEKFRKAALTTIHRLLDVVDDIESDDLDPSLSGATLRVSFERGAPIILSPQVPARELWLASDYQAWHFQQQPDGHWVARKTGVLLCAVLSEIFSKNLGVSVQF